MDNKQAKHERKAQRIATLLAGYMRDNLSSAEHDELDEWVGASDKNMRLFEELTDPRRVALALELLNDRPTLIKNIETLSPAPRKSIWKQITTNGKAAFWIGIVIGCSIGWAISGYAQIAHPLIRTITTAGIGFYQFPPFLFVS